MTRSAERGATLIVVLVVVVALLAAAAVLIRSQLNSTRSAGMAKSQKESLYCAEAGLAAARARIGESYAQWPDLLDADATNNPHWYPIQGDLDGDGEVDYEVTIRDNDDEAPPAPNNPAQDNDLRIFVVSRCVQSADSPQRVMELIRYEGGGTVYRHQAGQGSGNTGNIN